MEPLIKILICSINLRLKVTAAFIQHVQYKCQVSWVYILQTCCEMFQSLQQD